MKMPGPMVALESEILLTLLVNGMIPHLKTVPIPIPKNLTKCVNDVLDGCEKTIGGTFHAHFLMSAPVFVSFIYVFLIN